MRTLLTKDIRKAADALLAGNIIGMPTETVYGLAGLAYNDSAIRSIYEIKARPYNNPLILHVDNLASLASIAQDVPQLAYDLAEAFWPGPLTLILNKTSNVPQLVTGGQNTVAVRIPSHPVALELLKAVKFPLAAPSANPFGRVSPTASSHVMDYFNGKIPLILEGGNSTVGIESTIVGFDRGMPVVYRQGCVTGEDLKRFSAKVKLELKAKAMPVAPGMLSRHYSPKTPLIVVRSLQEAVGANPDRHLGTISFREEHGHKSVHHITLSEAGSLSEAGAGLYAALHQLDSQGLDLIIAEEFPSGGIGNALNDKLSRASKQ